ncbi:MAG: alpha/beta fold hydrolase [Alkalinema sp. RU_4_3]|nr:alpha/beta fold hydrolase [Alkalinema sp. RU_4_3]
MSTYILIHGAWHSSWCWHKVQSLLEQQGHRVLTPTLPGHGDDRTPIAEISLQAYTDTIGKLLTILSEPAILVGHSMGGIVLSQVAEQWPDKVKLLVYLSAYLLSGQSILDVSSEAPDSLVPPNLIIHQEQGICEIKPESIREIFYADCSEADFNAAKSHICPEPLAPFATPLQVTNERFGQVPRIYIQTLQDRAVTPMLQKYMYDRLPCQQVISMNTGHAPFLADPQTLTAHLLDLA